MTLQIGQWVARIAPGRVLTLPHYVESLIDDEPVTHCGRRLGKREGSKLLAVAPVKVCSDCRPMLREDDGSTHGETVP